MRILKAHPYAQVAQLVEQRIENPRVGGSIPPLGTIFQMNSTIYVNSDNRLYVAILESCPEVTRQLILETVLTPALVAALLGCNCKVRQAEKHFCNDRVRKIHKERTCKRDEQKGFRRRAIAVRPLLRYYGDSLLNALIRYCHL